MNAMKTIAARFENMGKEISSGKAFAILFLSYTLAMLTVFRANFNYVDDMGRALGGYDGWGTFSRYLSDILSHIIHMGGWLADISPIPQIIGLSLLAAAGIIVMKILSWTHKCTIWGIIGVIPLGISPYFMENLAYKYDAPYMALSVLAAVAPLAFLKYGTVVYMSSVFVGTIVVCTTYQVSTGIFPMLVIMVMLAYWCCNKEIKDILRFILESVLGYAVGIAVFRLFLMKEIDSYVSSHFASFDVIVGNYKQYFALAASDFRRQWLLAAAVLVAAVLIVSVLRTKRNKALTFFIALCSMVFLPFLMFGIYPALTAPLFAPRAMYGTGVCMAFLSVYCITGGGELYEMKKSPMKTGSLLYYILIRLVSIFLVWSFLVFGWTFGNCLAVQDEYIDFRMESVIHDMNDLDVFASEEVKTVTLRGGAGLAPALVQVSDNYPLLKRIIPIMFQENWVWGGQKFFYYYGLKNVQWEMYSDMSTDEMELIKDTMLHSIYEKDNYVVIQLK